MTAMLARTTEIEQATAKGDVRALFKLAAKRSVAKHKPKLQLRWPAAELWSPAQQTDCLRVSYADLYAESGAPAHHLLTTITLSTTPALRCFLSLDCIMCLMACLNFRLAKLHLLILPRAVVGSRVRGL